MFMLSCVLPLPLCFFFFLVGEGETCTEVVFAVQETFPPLRHYFTSNLFMCTPLCSLTRNCGEHELWGTLNSLDPERQGRDCRENWTEGVDDKSSLFLNWAKQEFQVWPVGTLPAILIQAPPSYWPVNCIHCLMWAWGGGGKVVGTAGAFIKPSQ